VIDRHNFLDYKKFAAQLSSDVVFAALTDTRDVIQPNGRDKNSYGQYVPYLDINPAAKGKMNK
jgi:hypothetical protein